MDAPDLETRLLKRLSVTQFRSPGVARAQTIDPRAIELRELTGIGLDTNVLKHFRNDPYLATTLAETLRDLDVTLIMPAQTVIEFWNNHRTFAKEDWNQINNDVVKLRKKLDDMGALPMAEVRIDAIKVTITELVSELQESTAPDFLQRSQQVMETLLEYALQPMVSRAVFHDIGLVRLRSKVPPGFADAAEKGELSLGDFFGWCDFMLGALSLDGDVGQPGRFLFITEETKPDWRTGLSAHPHLVHEFEQVTGGEVGVAYMADLRRLLKGAEHGISPTVRRDDGPRHADSSAPSSHSNAAQ